MGFGLPVLAHGVPAVRETLGRAGLAFGAKHFDHLAQTLASVLNDAERRSALVERQLQRHAELRQQMTGLNFLELVQPDWRNGLS
jgi:glycosyltransferase involved in cell wall biosynthesis